jgi:hypothetical protein
MRACVHVITPAFDKYRQAEPMVCDCIFLCVYCRLQTVSNNPFGVFGCNFLFEALKENSGLVEVHVNDCKMTDQGMDALVDALVFNAMCTTLGLCKNGLSNRGANRILDALKVNAKIAKVELWGTSTAIHVQTCLFVYTSVRVIVCELSAHMSLIFTIVLARHHCLLHDLLCFSFDSLMGRQRHG